MVNYIKIGIEKYDSDFSIPYDDDMTLEQFHKALEKVVGPCKLNISQFNKKKIQKLKDLFKGDTTIYIIDNVNLGNIIKKWKGNFINNNNSCFRDSFVQSIIHSMAESIVKNEDELRRKNGLPKSKNFEDYNNNSNNDSFYKDLLFVFDKIKEKIKKKDSSPISNTYDSSNKPKTLNYKDGGNYMPDSMTNLSNSSTSTNSGLEGKGLFIDLGFNSNPSNMCYVKDHQIYLNKKTVVSDIINIDVRSFTKCLNCYSSGNIATNIGNITIPMYDFLNTNQQKSFNSILKYYYKINNFGTENIKKNQYCKKCNTYNLEYYNKMSTLPDILIIDFNLHSYYDNTPDNKLKEESFYWVLEENISLDEHYDRIFYDSSSKKDCNYELTSFICHYGNHEYGHFINFSKIDGKWFLFDDLSNEEAVKYGNFQTVKLNIEKAEFGLAYEQKRNGLAYKKERIASKLKICNCFYERNILKGYENYINKYKEIIN